MMPILVKDNDIRPCETKANALHSQLQLAQESIMGKYRAVNKF